MKLITIVGARPQFIKAAVVSRAIAEYNKLNKGEYIEEKIIHTNQHYDENMSDIFLKRCIFRSRIIICTLAVVCRAL